MIVRNESAVIQRCLNSVKPLIDHWVIVDTGSSDDTCSIIDDEMSDIPGELHHRQWVNFGHNRTELLALAEGKADYLFVVDADMIVHIDDSFSKELTADSYHVSYSGDLSYYQKLLVKSSFAWQYIGVTHEYIHSFETSASEVLPHLVVEHKCDGGMRNNKFERDIKLLLRTIDENPDDARSVFYLAQTYRDIGNYRLAIKHYDKRANMGGWQEESWYAQLQSTILKLQMGRSCVEQLINLYNKRPHRAEPLYYLCRHFRTHQQFYAGFMFGEVGSQVPIPQDDILFVHKDIYTWRLKDEYALCAYYCGKYQLADQIFAQIENIVPIGDYSRIQKNRIWAQSHL